MSNDENMLFKVGRKFYTDLKVAPAQLLKKMYQLLVFCDSSMFKGKFGLASPRSNKARLEGPASPVRPLPYVSYSSLSSLLSVVESSILPV